MAEYMRSQNFDVGEIKHIELHHEAPRPVGFTIDGRSPDLRVTACLAFPSRIMAQWSK